jgi:hypothetical protein
MRRQLNNHGEYVMNAINNTKHTPGEWKTRTEGFDEKPYWGDVEVYTEDYGKVCALADNWSIWNSDGNEDAAIECRKEAEANAKLIAAAPELLEALKECRKWYENNTDRLYPDTPICFSNALSAIQKATV